MRRKIIVIGTLISALITLVQVFAPYLVGYYRSYQLKLNHSSLVIIGGADGPTSIFVSSNYNQLFRIVPFLITIVGMIYLIRTKSKSTKE